MPTETRCTNAVAAVMPISTGTGLKRVAKVSAISCDLSPSSATKMTAKLSARAARKPFTKRLPGYRDREEGAGRPRPGRQGTTAKSKVSLASDEAARPDLGNPGSACRPRRWELLPFAGTTLPGGNSRPAGKVALLTPARP